MVDILESYLTTSFYKTFPSWEKLHFNMTMAVIVIKCYQGKVRDILKVYVGVTW